MPMTIGRRLVKRLENRAKAAGLTRAEWARKAGVTPQALSNYLSKVPAVQREPSLATLDALAKPLGLTLELAAR